MNVFISGGCKNGKSYYAQELARDMAQEKGLPLYYLATMEPVDGEDEERILRHRKEREGWGFETIEQPRNLQECLPRLEPGGVVLLDSVTALLSNEMFPPYREDKPWEADLDAPERVLASLKKFGVAMGNTIFVSDYIYGEFSRHGNLTEEYQRGLASIDRSLAKFCDKLIEVSIGFRWEYK